MLNSSLEDGTGKQLKCFDFENLLKPSPDIKIDRPLFMVWVKDHSPGTNGITLEISRMDGMPARDPWGEKLRQDTENWQTFDQVIRTIEAIVCGLPQYFRRRY